MSFFFSPFVQTYQYPSYGYRRLYREPSLSDLLTQYSEYDPYEFYSPPRSRSRYYVQPKPNYVYLNRYRNNDENQCQCGSVQCCANQSKPQPQQHHSSPRASQPKQTEQKEKEKLSSVLNDLWATFLDTASSTDCATKTADPTKQADSTNNQSSKTKRLKRQRKQPLKKPASTAETKEEKKSISPNLSQEPVLTEFIPTASDLQSKRKYGSTDDDDSDALEWEEIEVSSSGDEKSDVKAESEANERKVSEHKVGENEIKVNDKNEIQTAETTESKNNEDAETKQPQQTAESEKQVSEPQLPVQSETTASETSISEPKSAETSTTSIPINIVQPKPKSKATIAVYRQIPLSCAFDINESSTSYTISAKIPLVTKDEITLELDDGILSIRASKSNTIENKSDDEKIYRIEHAYTPIERSLKLPKDIEIYGVNAKHENDTLIITLPKIPSKQPKRICIQ